MLVRVLTIVKVVQQPQSTPRRERARLSEGLTVTHFQLQSSGLGIRFFEDTVRWKELVGFRGCTPKMLTRNFKILVIVLATKTRVTSIPEYVTTTSAAAEDPGVPI